MEFFGVFDFWEYDLGGPFEDREGNTWIPQFYGVTKLARQHRLFENYLHEPLNALGAVPGGKSKVAQGTEFIVSLPVSRNAPIEDEGEAMALRIGSSPTCQAHKS